MIVETLDKNGPLCPMGFGPTAAKEHTIVTTFGNRLYEALKTHIGMDDEGQLASTAESIYHDVMYADDRNMRLYKAEAQPVRPMTLGMVRGYWWQCPVCGFVLPATAVD